MDAKSHYLLEKRKKFETNHILHLLVSIFTIGLWIPVWVIVGICNSIGYKEADQELKKHISLNE